MKYCGEMLGIPNQSSERDLRVYVAYFFTKVFAFLIPYTKWCTSRCTRFKASFDSDFYETKVQGPLDDILAQSRNLERRGNLLTLRTVSEIKIDNERMFEQNERMCQLMRDSINEKYANRVATQVGAESFDNQASLNQMFVTVGQLATQLNQQTALNQELQREKALRAGTYMICFKNQELSTDKFDQKLRNLNNYRISGPLCSNESKIPNKQIRTSKSGLFNLLMLKSLLAISKSE